MEQRNPPGPFLALAGVFSGGLWTVIFGLFLALVSVGQ